MMQLRTRPHRWWALAALVLAVIAIGLDATVLTLALPTLAGALNASESDLQWFVSAYALALAASMIPAGLIGDRYGRKTVMAVALVVFGLASISCAYSTGATMFVVARIVLGIAGAALIVMSLSVLTVLFDEAERPRAMGIWAAGNFLSMPLGPIVGGWILAHAWWGWVFLLNVPIVLVGIVAVVALVPQAVSDRRPSIDILGVLASSAGLALIMYGVTQAGEKSWNSTDAVLPVLFGALSILAFVLWETWLSRRGGEPLMDLNVFRSRSFTWGIILGAVGVFGLFGVLFGLPQYLQGIAGLDAQGTGFRYLPAIGGMVLGSIPADRAVARIGTKATVVLGFVLMAAGLMLGATMQVGTSDAFIALWTFLTGMGAGLGLATAASAAIVELDAEHSGVGSAMLQAVIKLGPAFGATIMGSVLNSTYQAQLDVRGLAPGAAAAAQQSLFGGLAVAHKMRDAALAVSAQNAFVAGMDDAIRVAGVVAIVAGGLALIFLPRRLSVRPRPVEVPSSVAAAASTGASMAPRATMEP